MSELMTETVTIVEFLKYLEEYELKKQWIFSSLSRAQSTKKKFGFSRGVELVKTDLERFKKAIKSFQEDLGLNIPSVGQYITELISLGLTPTKILKFFEITEKNLD